VFTKCSPLESPDRAIVHSLKRDSILREAGDSPTRLAHARSPCRRGPRFTSAFTQNE
jgi:hypothetical protein